MNTLLRFFISAFSLWAWNYLLGKTWLNPVCLLKFGGSDAPDPPDYAEANREAILTDIETLPDRYAARAEWEPLLLQLMLESQADSADYTADAMLRTQETYGPAFVQARQRELEMSDPQGMAAREALYNEVMYGLTGKVPDKVEYEVTYPEQPGEVDPNFDVEARINQILGARPGSEESGQAVNDQMAAIVEAMYPIDGKYNSKNGWNAQERKQQIEKRNALYEELGVDPSEQGGKGDEPSSTASTRGSLSADEWDTRAAELREKFSAGAIAKRGMPEVTEIRTPGEYSINEDLAVGEDYESNRISQTLYDQVLSDLGLGAELNDGVRREVQQAVRGGQAARGNIMGNSAIYEEAMQTGMAGEQRQLQRQGTALGFLNSGATPEDIAYRKRQQALANVGSFMAGTTPVTQFGQLAGAQQGAAPYIAQNAPAALNANAGAQGTQFALQSYGQQSSNWQQEQSGTNPWVAGLGLGLAAFTGGASLGVSAGIGAAGAGAGYFG